ncbi:RNA polymerase sigma factor [Nonomuraea candida]|uniref:RNA polymerase sigma factor n=1 Tax=Nonomuraea candida TaxID=359159 RepID=UPI000ABAE124|nr:sigma-70 family RNA polymerase sigma factor [Nonomuraea candida]
MSTLVLRARNGDQQAWDAIVDRYAPLVWSICRRYGLDRLDSDDVGQTVWLRLLENLGRLREPAALPGWLERTTKNECLRVVQTTRRLERTEERIKREPSEQVDPFDELLEQSAAERDNALLREAFAQLPDRYRQLLLLLMADPPVSYEEISRRLDRPIGSIGPQRARSLAALRKKLAEMDMAGVGMRTTGR